MLSVDCGEREREIENARGERRPDRCETLITTLMVVAMMIGAD